MPREGTKTNILFPNTNRTLLRLDMPREGTKTSAKDPLLFCKRLRLDMPREGTKTQLSLLFQCIITIEIRYAPGGDENHQLF